MPRRIANIFEPLLGRLFPPHGRHRAPDGCPVLRGADAPTLTLPRLTRTSSLAPWVGQDDTLIRPYVLSPEERAERREGRSQGERRRALWLASHGVDVGPRRVHGVEVAP